MSALSLSCVRVMLGVTGSLLCIAADDYGSRPSVMLERIRVKWI